MIGRSSTLSSLWTCTTEILSTDLFVTGSCVHFLLSIHIMYVKCTVLRSGNTALHCRYCNCSWKHYYCIYCIYVCILYLQYYVFTRVCYVRMYLHTECVIHTYVQYNTYNIYSLLLSIHPSILCVRIPLYMTCTRFTIPLCILQYHGCS